MKPNICVLFDIMFSFCALMAVNIFQPSMANEMSNKQGLFILVLPDTYLEIIYIIAQ